LNIMWELLTTWHPNAYIINHHRKNQMYIR
jgi:hypothetical protein